MTHGQQKRALRVAGTRELAGHRVERLGPAAVLGGVQVVAFVDRDPTGGAVREEQSRLLLRKHREALVLGREEATKLSGRWVQVLVGEQCDLALETAERGLLERPSHEIRAYEQRKGNGGKNGQTDREP